MTWLNQGYPLSRARQAGRAFYELSITNWANRGGPNPPGPAQDLNSLIYPATGQPPLTGIYGMMIAPGSLWDRCYVTYNVAASGGAAFGPSSAPLNITTQLSTKSPIMYSLGSDIVISPFIRTGFTAKYIKENSGSLVQSNFTSLSLEHPVLTEAYLSLILFLQPPGQVVTTRAPYVVNDQTVTLSGTGPAESGPAIYNIAGRRHIRGTLRSAATVGNGVWSFRLATLSTVPDSGVQQEKTIASIAGINTPSAGNVGAFDLNLENTADWLLIYGTRSDNGGDLTLDVAFIASD